mmetsp:Transcript_139003/g.241737  ORF Transcript_139003/g.241737 Transcript_139003/m.241737 type:complete len:208 (-) Transcript_139003:2153-2776(-)
MGVAAGFRPPEHDTPPTRDHLREGMGRVCMSDGRIPATRGSCQGWRPDQTFGSSGGIADPRVQGTAGGNPRGSSTSGPCQGTPGGALGRAAVWYKAWYHAWPTAPSGGPDRCIASGGVGVSRGPAGDRSVPYHPSRGRVWPGPPVKSWNILGPGSHHGQESGLAQRVRNRGGTHFPPSTPAPALHLPPSLSGRGRGTVRTPINPNHY